ncbi:062e9ba7-bc94-4329-a598-02fbd8de3881 [Thermothielavioides terrestris]|nr:062e9ba7-bc94-4329-a598-02fbd8de3881 [Thermothielavioides terrestris]
MEDKTPASVASTLSWNTSLSRTYVSSLSRAIFSARHSQSLHSLDDVLKVIRALGLPRYRYENLSREEVLGEGETYLVERCVAARDGRVFAVKHLKVRDGKVFDKAFHR